MALRPDGAPITLPGPDGSAGLTLMGLVRPWGTPGPYLRVEGQLSKQFTLSELDLIGGAAALGISPARAGGKPHRRVRLRYQAVDWRGYLADHRAFLGGSLLTGIALWGFAYAAHFETYRWSELEDLSGVRQVLELDAGLLPGGGVRVTAGCAGTWDSARVQNLSYLEHGPILELVWASGPWTVGVRGALAWRSYLAPDPAYSATTREDTRYFATTWVELGLGARWSVRGNRAAAPHGLQHPGHQRHGVDLHRQRGLDGGGALMRRALLPLVLAVVGLAGAGLATLRLHRAATTALQRATEERLHGAGTTAARTLEQPGFAPDPAWLRSVVDANGLEGALLLDSRLHVVADPSGAGDRPVDLLRVDAARVRRAFAGEPSLSLGWAVGDARVATAYLPVHRGDTVDRVLVLEGGEGYAARQADLDRALHLGWLLSACAAVVTALVAAGWAAAERRERELATRAARGAAVAQLAAMVAHDVRTPLSVIRGTVELMVERADGRLGERDAEALEDILGEVARLRRLTEDFLDLSSDRPLAGVDLDVASFLDEAARAGRAATGLDIDVEAPAALHVRGDGGRLRQVFLNLVTNAARAGAHRVRLRAARDGRRVRLEVADDGPGIPEAIRPRLFEPFATTREDGNGLGLALSRRIVERHGGSLALVPRGSGRHVSHRAAADGGGRVMGDILVVDDEPKLGKLVAEMLELDGHHVQRVGGGKEALSAMANFAMDVVVTDLRMPEVDGLAVLASAVQQADAAGRDRR